VKKIIVTNTGDTVVSKQLLERADLDVLVVTEPRFAGSYPPGTRIAFVDNLNDPARSAEQAAAEADLSDREHVLALSERAALTAGYLRSWLGLDGPGVETVLGCTNKYVMKQRLSAAGLRTAPFRLAGSPAQVRAAVHELGLPAVIKPVLGAGSDAMFVVRSTDELHAPPLKAYLGRLLAPATTSEKTFPVIVESMLPLSAELHCDGYVEGGVVRYARVSRYLRPVLQYAGAIFGSSTLAQDDPVAIEVQRLHARAVSALGLGHATTHLEVLDVDGALHLGEIAARPGGGGIRRMLQLRDGFDSREAMVRAGLCESYRPEVVTRDTEVLQLMLPADRGTVREISSASDLLGVPGVVEADLRLVAGDTVDGLMDSSTVSGLVFADVTDESSIRRITEAVERRFTLRVDR
jgi:biotin carboxylase